jgi:hypothetical protein
MTLMHKAYNRSSIKDGKSNLSRQTSSLFMFYANLRNKAVFLLLFLLYLFALYNIPANATEKK